MLLNSFAHRLLLTFGFVVLSILTVLAAKVGWLGELPQAWVLWALYPLQEFYAENKGDLDFAAKIIGVLGTALGAAWTVHKGWHYAERNLPARLNEFNARWKEAIESSRPELIPALAQIASIAPPIFEKPGLLRRLIWRIYDPAERTLAKSREALSKCENEFGVLTNSRVRCRAEVVTLHLALGSQLARTVSDGGQDAFNAYNKALTFNRTDLDALELAAKQAYVLNLRPKASEHLMTLADAASRAGKPIRHARALRFNAEILHDGPRNGDRELARDNLIAAISVLSGSDACNANERECELGLAKAQLGAVQITRERFSAARNALNAADIHFQRLPSPSGAQGLKQVQELRERLARAENDRDNPDVPD